MVADHRPWLLTIAYKEEKKKKKEKKGMKHLHGNKPSPPSRGPAGLTRKGRKQFQLRVQALLQLLMEMNGGAESSTV